MGSTIKRVGLGLATGGASEVVRAVSSGRAKDAIGVGKYQGSTLGVKEDEFTKKLEGEGNQAEVRKQQQSQSKRLEDQATGNAPSLAEAQLKSSTNRSLAQQLAASQAQRGGSSALRERQLMKSQGAARRETAESAAVARIQEQQAAEQQLATQLQNQRATDINLAEADRQSAQKLEELLVQENLGVQGLNLSGFQSSQQNRANLISSIGSGLAGAASDKNLKTNIKKDDITKLGAKLSTDKSKSTDDSEKEPSKTSKFAKGFSDQSKKNSTSSDGVGVSAAQSAQNAIKNMSDENSKKNIKEDDNEDFSARSFLDALQAYTYEYKDDAKKLPLAGEGKRLSVMAQDLEKAGPVGRSMVKNTPEGKMVDYGRGFGAILAAQSHLNQRLAELEKKKK